MTDKSETPSDKGRKPGGSGQKNRFGKPAASGAKRGFGPKTPGAKKPGFGANRSFKKPFSAKSNPDESVRKPFQSGSDNDSRRPDAEKRPYRSAAGGPRPEGTGRPGARPGNRPSGRPGSSFGGDKPPFRKPYGERTAEVGSAEKRPYRSAAGGPRSEGTGGRPGARPGNRPGGRPGSSFVGDKPPFRKPYGERQAEDGSSEKRSYRSAAGGPRPEGAGRPDARPGARPGGRPGGRPGSSFVGDKPPFRKPYGEHPAEDVSGEKRPYRPAMAGRRPGGFGGNKPPYRKPFNDTPRYDGGDKRLTRKTHEAAPETDGMPNENPKRFPRTRVMGRTDEMPFVRLNKWIADSGMCSRREADELITSGQVAINRRVVRTLGTCIVPNQDEVTVGGRAIVSRKRKTYVLFHKPKDCLVTRDDPEGRQTIYAYLPEKYQHCDPVGRLDRDSTGLMLLSDDGDWVHQLSHPSYHMTKTYRVHVDLPLTEAAIKELKKGVPLEPEGVTAYCESIRWQDLRQLELELVTGYNRQIRRMMDHLGYEVTRLKRTRLGPLTLDSLPPGSYRPVSASELSLLRQALPKPERRPAGNMGGFGARRPLPSRPLPGGGSSPNRGQFTKR